MFKLRLKNYRGFSDEEFDFSRINILIGENSAGKSSIFKFLLALKQSFRSPNNREYNLTFSGVDTNLGNYKEVVFNHEIRRKISFSFEFNNDYVEYFLDYLAPTPSNSGKKKDLNKKAFEQRNEIISHLGSKNLSPTIISFKFTNDLSKHINISTKIFNEDLGDLEIVHPQGEIQVEQDIYLVGENPECEIHFHSKKFDKTFVFQKVKFEKEAFLSIVDGASLNKIIEEQDKENTKKIFNQIAFLLVVQNYVALQVNGIEYINPLVSKPATRVYLEEDRKSINRIRDINDLVDFLDNPNTRPLFKERLTKILSEFGIADEIEIKKEGQIRELRIVLNEVNNNIVDVGFGVSLQLPIFAQAMLSDVRVRPGKNGDTLLIEQPEVHLHPRLQAKFVEALLGIGENNIYFIETHSEHIVRMLQILVRENKNNLESQDVSIHYLKKHGKNIVISQHKIDDETGKLKPNFPKGFYDVSYDLAFQLMD
jgi:predicted ATPase